MWTRSRFEKFPALSDKNLMKAAGQGPGHSMANRLPFSCVAGITSIVVLLENILLRPSWPRQ
jgi:hypothetical protein